jgi:hypothetical protein
MFSLSESTGRAQGRLISANAQNSQHALREFLVGTGSEGSRKFNMMMNRRAIESRAQDASAVRGNIASQTLSGEAGSGCQMPPDATTMRMAGEHAGSAQVRIFHILCAALDLK